MKIIGTLIVSAFTLYLTVNGDTPHVESNGQEKEGKCPTIKPLANFTIDQFMGRWYGYASSKLVSFEPLWKCCRIEVTKTGNNTFKLRDNNYIRLTGTKAVIEFSNTVHADDESKFDSVPSHVGMDSKLNPFPRDLGMDLKNKDADIGYILAYEEDFLVMYKCGNTKDKNTHKDGAFILARHRPLSAEKIQENHDRAVKILHENGIYDSEPLISMIQPSECDKSFNY